MMRLLFVDDQACFRECLALALSALPGIQVAGQAGSCREALSAIERLRPDLVVSQLLLPDSDALSLALELRRRRDRTPMMLLTHVNYPIFFEQSVKAGIRGYALKDESLADIADAIRLVAIGGTYVSPGLRGRPAPQDSPFRRISAREREILCLLIRGLSTKEIARRLFLSPKTVDAHRLHINRKLGVSSPVGLAHLAAHERLLA